jgi:hypothetical protein
MNDNHLIEALANAENVAIWHGYWQPTGQPRRTLVIIYRTDDDGNLVDDEETGDTELARGETLREALSKLP